LIYSSLLPLAKKNYDSSLSETNSSFARRQLSQFKSTDQQSNDEIYTKLVEQQALFIVTLGSQEGAFENVRMTYAGDQGPLIKQLIQTHAIRRTSMCCLASKHKKHLIVTHEKGKSSHFTILQLNALLKQDSSKRNKLTLTKLNTIPVPFTLLSAVANQFNEDYIALTGLKDCYVMYLNENGQTKQEILLTSSAPAPTPILMNNNITASSKPVSHKTIYSTTSSNSAGLIVLHPSLESSNFIIKAIWLPGSKSELALVTADFIKIYDLSVDKISPIYYYLLPMGKIKDVTFFYENQSE
jgi:E3 ubiquitin-protein ligase UBR4